MGGHTTKSWVHLWTIGYLCGKLYLKHNYYKLLVLLSCYFFSPHLQLQFLLLHYMFVLCFKKVNGRVTNTSYVNHVRKGGNRRKYTDIAGKLPNWRDILPVLVGLQCCIFAYIGKWTFKSSLVGVRLWSAIKQSSNRLFKIWNGWSREQRRKHKRKYTDFADGLIKLIVKLPGHPPRTRGAAVLYLW